MFCFEKSKKGYMAEKDKRKPGEEFLGDSQHNNNVLLGLLGTHGLTRAHAKKLVTASPNDQHRLVQDLANSINLLDAGGNTLLITRKSTVPKIESGVMVVDYHIQLTEQVGAARVDGLYVARHLESIFSVKSTFSVSVTFDYCVLEPNITPEGAEWVRADVEHILAYALMIHQGSVVGARRVISSSTMSVYNSNTYYCESRLNKGVPQVVIALAPSLKESLHLWVREKKKPQVDDWEI